MALDREYSAPLLTLLMQGAGLAALSDGTQQLPLVSAAEMRVFESLSHLLDPNPRRLKRIISVYALVTEVAKRVPLSNVGSTACATVNVTGPWKPESSLSKVSRSKQKRTGPRQGLGSRAVHIASFKLTSVVSRFSLSKTTRGGLAFAPSLPSGSAYARTTRTACPS